MRKYTTILLALLVQFALEAGGQTNIPQWASIKAFLPAWEGAAVTITVDKIPVFKGIVQSGMVSFNHPQKTISEASLEVKGQRSAHLFFFTEPGVIRITYDGRELRASGTPTNDKYSQIEQEMDSIVRLGTDGSQAAVKALKQELVADIVMKEPASLISLRMLYQYYYGERGTSDTLYHRLYQLLEPGLKNTATGKTIYEEVKKRYQVAVGRPAAAMFLPDVQKQMQPVYVKGEYTLIHFWASWCQPCIKANRSLKDLQEEQPAGLNLVGISVDANYSAWTAAIRKENLNWKQLNDLKGWKGEVVNRFSVESIPANILVDPDGIIIARNVSADDLRKRFSHASPKIF